MIDIGPKLYSAHPIPTPGSDLQVKVMDLEILFSVL